MNTPVLIIVYNRPQITEKQLMALKKIKPVNLYVFCDGPKSQSELKPILETRKLFNKLGWDCDVKTNFQQKNLGCKLGVITAINWFFKNVSEGIILEDDCIPDASFFDFLSSLLKKYRNDKKISMISGSNLGFKNKNNDSYFYSRYSIVWGWATWANRWNSYRKILLKNENEVFSKKNIDVCKKLGISNKFINNTIKSFQGRIDTWDYLWTYTNLINDRLSIIPSKNLIKNIGFGKQATHTKIITSLSELRRESTSKKIIHPQELVSNNKFDSYVTNTHNSVYLLFDFIILKIKRLFK